MMCVFFDVFLIVMFYLLLLLMEMFELLLVNFDDVEIKFDVEVEKIFFAKFESAKKFNFVAALDDFFLSDDEDVNCRLMLLL